METFEREALGRGCRQVVQETYEFQAPEFYRRRGFELIASVPDHPPGRQSMTAAMSPKRCRALADLSTVLG
jgi:hypothetical protein